MLVNLKQKQLIYIYKNESKAEYFEIDNTTERQITDIFWVKQRLIALDSSLLFHDLTHNKQLIKLTSQEHNRLP